MRKRNQKTVVLFQAPDGAIELRGDYAHDTIWATQDQISRLFVVDQSVVSRHIANIFRDKEIDQKSNMQNMHNALSDKPVRLYSLDVILSVGYRVNSSVAIIFLKWATKTLRDHIVRGYTINRKRISNAFSRLSLTVSLVASSARGEVGRIQ